MSAKSENIIVHNESVLTVGYIGFQKSLEDPKLMTDSVQLSPFVIVSTG